MTLSWRQKDGAVLPRTGGEIKPESLSALTNSSACRVGPVRARRLTILHGVQGSFGWRFSGPSCRYKLRLVAAKANEPRRKQNLQVRREISAGGVIWRRQESDGRIQVVLVRPAGRDTWVLPKGHVEPGEAVLDAAVREACEESGLQFTPGERLGDVSYVYSWHDRPDLPPVRIFKRVYFYLMESHGGDLSAHDAEIDEATWVDLDEAPQRASHKSERELLAKARALLER